MGDYVGKFWQRKEFACSCGCNTGEIHPKLVELADLVRENIGVPLTCTSGIRCETRNAAVGGAKNSLHIPSGSCQFGHAGDFTFYSPILRQKLNILHLYYLFESHGREFGALGLGLYNSWIHVDVRGAGLGLTSGRWSESFDWPYLRKPLI